MAFNTPCILDVLPIDILSYFVEQIVNEEETLRALSRTCRAFSLLALPRVRSHTVVLDISTGLRTGVVEYKRINDFIHERNFRIPSLVRVLEIRDRFPEPSTYQTNVSINTKVKEFVEILYLFISKCVGLRKFLRDGYENSFLKTTDLIPTVLGLPKLKVLCLKIHQDKEWYFNETPQFEEYECDTSLENEKDAERGLACFSVALPMQLARNWWDDVWVMCCQILLDNKKTLRHLIFDGPDLEQIAKRMSPGSLAEVRLETLRFRMGFNPKKFLEVLNLTGLSTNPYVEETVGTRLKRLEFYNLQNKTTQNDMTSAQMLRRLRTPNLKTMQIFGDQGRFIDVYLRTFQGLQSAEFQYCTSLAWLQGKIHVLAMQHGQTLRTIKFHRATLDMLWGPDANFFQGFSCLKRLEIVHEQSSFFSSVDTLWAIIKYQPTISEVQITMHQPFSGLNHRFMSPSIGTFISLPRRILTAIYSTAFFLRNRRSGVDTSHYPGENSELFFSTKVVTPCRAMLGDTNSDQLYFNTYFSHMFHTKRLPAELAQFPDPRPGFMPGLKLENDVAAFSSFVEGVPESLKVFELQYVQRSGSDKCESVRRDKDKWQKVDEEWVYVREGKRLFNW